MKDEEFEEGTPLMEEDELKQSSPLMESQKPKYSFLDGLGSSNPMKISQSNSNENEVADEPKTEVPHNESNSKERDDAEPISIVGQDLTEYFSTDIIFDSKEAVTQWCQDMGREHNVSEHAKLKRWLDTNSGNFVTCWHTMHLMLQTEISEIKADFEKSLTQTKHRHQIKHLTKLRNYVSHLALDRLVDELDRIGKEGMTKADCRCVVRSTHGLPCACELVRFQAEGISIPLTAIEPHWKQLSSVPYVEEAVAFDFLPELKHMRQRWIEGSEPERAALVQKMKEFGTASSTRMQEPNDKVKTKGRRSKKQRQADESTKRNPSLFEHELASSANSTVKQQVKKKTLNAKGSIKTSSAKATINSQQSQTADVMRNAPTTPNLPPRWNYLSQLPKPMQTYISSIEDVPGDGHCGYHVVAMKMGLDLESGWKDVRQAMVKELDLNIDFYTKMFDLEIVHKLRKRFDYYGDRDITSDYWLQMPEAGFIIAEAFVTVVVLISRDMNFTFVPSRYPYSQYTRNRLIVMAHVNSSHYVGLTLNPGSPMPPEPPYQFWKRTVTDHSKAWLSMFSDQIAEFEKIMGYVKEQSPVNITLDD
ncbi:Ovarian tumor [Macleaya cordata]|uniref:Ovarian tumor n=2 Tax=Macleaya cordata TaxID=56857 RepID=A0A200Q5I7_MACCD|nr:Ovarian tumor [Macleaya cordata]